MTVVELQPDLKRRLGELNTVADRIRLLDREGIARADIARILDKRYQHVRNVLERDREKSTAPPVITPGRPVRLEVTADGSLTIPAELLREVDALPGSAVNLHVKDGELRIVPLALALKQVQAYLATIIPPEVNLTDELIADRRAEAARE